MKRPGMGAVRFGGLRPDDGQYVARFLVVEPGYLGTDHRPGTVLADSFPLLERGAPFRKDASIFVIVERHKHAVFRISDIARKIGHDGDLPDTGQLFDLPRHGDGYGQIVEARPYPDAV